MKVYHLIGKFTRKHCKMWILVCIALVLLYHYATRDHDYWKTRGVPHDKPLPFIGTQSQFLSGSKTRAIMAAELYKKYEGEPLVGCFRGNTPELLVRDPELVRYVLSTDFKVMHQRGDGKEPMVEPMMPNLFTAEGEAWKLLRRRLSPFFSTERLRNLFPMLTSCGKRLREFAEETFEKPVDTITLTDKYAAQVMGSCIFGLSTDSISETYGEAVRSLKYYFTISKPYLFYRGIREIFPDFTLLQTVVAPGRKGRSAMIKAVDDAFKRRSHMPSENNDFVDHVMSMYNDSPLRGVTEETKAEELEVNLPTCAGQVFLFLTAGIETNSTAMSCTLHQLAHHPDILKRVHKEVDEVFEKYDNNLTLEAINDLALLEMCFKESLRIFSPAGYTTRVSSVRYTLPKVGVTIDKGVRILVSLQGLHHDPKYFPDPLKFIPERHTAEEESKRPKYTFLPFGAGPRKCIGYRLARQVAIGGLASLLRNYQVSPAPGSSYELCARADIALVTQVKGGVPLVFTPRDSIASHKVKSVERQVGQN